MKGSVLGGLGIVVENVDDLLQNTVEGDLTWSRPANPAKSNRLYRSGFPDAGNVVELFATGARYLAPVKNVNPRVLGLTDANNLVEVFLTGANAEDALPLATAEGMKGTVSATNKVTFSNDFTINTRRAKLTFTAKTGAFKGTITLEDNNPLLPEKKVKRPVTFQGLIVEGQGEGYFILNQLPAVIGDTPANTPQQGGKVVVAPVVVP